MQNKVSLKKYTTLRVGGDADIIAKVSSVSELKQSIEYARANDMPFFVLGGGSNVLFSDEGFRGLVIKIEMSGFDWRDIGDRVEVGVSAGEDWDSFVQSVIAQGLYGAENLSGIPGTVGAAPVQNIGAYGAEVKDIIECVEVLDTETLEEKTFNRDECCFSYRNSYFKTAEGKRYIITRVVFTLSKIGAPDITYRDLAEYFAGQAPDNISLAQVREAVLAIRAKKFPDLSRVGCAGSFFKNPIVTKDRCGALKEKFGDIPNFDIGDGRVKLSAAWLIDKVCGLKGYTEGSCGIFENQALVLVNYGGASASDIRKLAEKVKSAVKEKTGVDIEEEVMVV